MLFGVVGFRPSSRSRHVSRCVRSIPSYQRTPCSSRPSMGPRKKASGPVPISHSSRVTYMNPRLSGPFPWPHRFRIIPQDAQLGRSYSTSQRPQLLKRRPSAKTVAFTLVTS